MSSTAAATVSMIYLDRLVPRKGNRQVGGMSKQSLQELAASIKYKGMLEHLIVRPLGDYVELATGTIQYEIVAGERRFKAAALAGLEAVPCQVRQMSDAEADEIALIDNVHRENLHPMDEAALYAAIYNQVVNQEKADAGPETVAAKVGKPVQYVVQRMQLIRLVASACDLWRKDEHVTLSHALLIAKLPPHVQENLVKALKGGKNWVLERGFQNFERFIESEIYMVLDGAPWEKDDEQLLSGAGACITCPKRTGANTMLFPEVGKHDTCLDGACFARKLEAHLARKKAELKTRPHLVVSSEYGGGAKDALTRYAWEECKKSDVGAIECLIADGQSRGRIVWGRKRSNNDGARAVLTDAERAKQRQDIERNRIRRQVAVQTFKITLETLKERLANDSINQTSLLRYFSFWIFDRCGNSHNEIGAHYRWVEKKTSHKFGGHYNYSTMSYEPAAKAALAAMTIRDLYHFIGVCLAAGAVGREPMLTDDLKQLAELAGVKIDAIEGDVKKAAAAVKTARKKKKASAKKPAAPKAVKPHAPKAKAAGKAKAKGL